LSLHGFNYGRSIGFFQYSLKLRNYSYFKSLANKGFWGYVFKYAK